MASHSYGPTATAGMRPNLRESVNVERGRPSEGRRIGEGWERRTLYQRLLNWLDDSNARKASSYLTKRRIRKEREVVRATARQMCRDMGRPVPRALAES